MTHIKITKGLDIPIQGKPGGVVKSLISAGESSSLKYPFYISLDLKPFNEVKFKVLAKVGDIVKVGQPLLEDKSHPGRFVVSPAGGRVTTIRRGDRRVLLEIIIEVFQEEQFEVHPSVDIQRVSREELIGILLKGGIFSRIRKRPFNTLADPTKVPRSIFVKAIDTAPFAPPPELVIQGHEKEFQKGLQALAKLTSGDVHLVYGKDSTCRAFSEATSVKKHTIEGPHPAGTHSVHIQAIDPIRKPEDVVWTLTVHDVIAIGHFLDSGKYFTERVIGIGGPGVLPDRVGYFRVREGFPVKALVAGRVGRGAYRMISGDPLMGHAVTAEEHLGFYDHVFCIIPENEKREFLHFFRLGLQKYSFSRAYLSGIFNKADKEYDFTTNQHGERRAFIDSTLYDKVMPLDISTMLLVKAVMAEDYELAEQLGLLEVDGEDFALPTFVCPSKIEMVEIIRNGLKQYQKEVFG
jgi:Na+-transporting NADH:ubiquinone oxidoreductase subunit A